MQQANLPLSAVVAVRLLRLDAAARRHTRLFSDDR